MSGSRLLVAALGAWAILLGGTATAKVGDFQFVIGEVRVLDAVGKPRPVQRGDLINEGETILTGADGNAQLVLIDQTRLTVRPSTELKVSEFKYEKNRETDRGLLSLTKGVFRTVTGLIGRTNRARYQVATPNATIGIRGSQGLVGHLDTGSWLSIEDERMSMGNQGGELVGGKGDIFNAPNPFTLLKQNFLPEDMKNVQTTNQQQAKKQERQQQQQQQTQQQRQQQEQQEQEQQKQQEQRVAQTGAGAEGDTALAAGGGAAPGGGAPAGGTAGGGTGETGTGGTTSNVQNTLPITLVSETGEVVNITGEGTVDTGAGGGETGPCIACEELLAALQALKSSLEAEKQNVVQLFNSTDPAAAFQDAYTAAQTAGSAVSALAPIDTSAISTEITNAQSQSTTVQSLINTLNTATAPDGAQINTNFTTVQTAYTALNTKVVDANTAWTTPLVGQPGSTPDMLANQAMNLINPAATQATSDVNMAQFEVNKLNAELNNFTTGKTAAQTAFQNAQTAIQNAQSQLGQLATINTVITAAKTQATTLLAQLQTVLTTAQQSFNAAQSAAQLTVSRIQLALSLLAPGTLADAQTALTQAQQAFSTLQQQLAALAAQVEIARQTRDTLQGVLSAQNTALTGAQTTLSAAQQAVTTATTALTNAQTAANGANTALTNANTSATTIQNALTSLQNQSTIINNNLGPQVAYKNPVANPAYLGQVWPGIFTSLKATGASSGNTNYALHRTGYPAIFRGGTIENFDSAGPCYVEGQPCGPTELTFSEGPTPNPNYAQELFSTPGGTIYVGRLVGGEIRAATSPAPTVIQIPPGVSSHFLFALVSPDAIPRTVGGFSYARIGGTSPSDMGGSLGTVTNSTFTVDFTAAKLGYSFDVVMGGGSKTWSVTTNGPTVDVSGTSFDVFFGPAICTGSCGAVYPGNSLHTANGTFTGGTSSGTMPYLHAGMIYRIEGRDSLFNTVDLITGTNVYGAPGTTANTPRYNPSLGPSGAPGAGVALAYLHGAAGSETADSITIAPTTTNLGEGIREDPSNLGRVVNAVTNLPPNRFSFSATGATHTAGPGGAPIVGQTSDGDGGLINWGRWSGSYVVADLLGVKMTIGDAQYMYSNNITRPDRLQDIFNNVSGIRDTITGGTGSASYSYLLGGGATSRTGGLGNVMSGTISVDFVTREIPFYSVTATAGPQNWSLQTTAIPQSIANFMSPTGITLGAVSCSGCSGGTSGTGKAHGQFVGPNVNAIISAFSGKAGTETIAGTMAVSRSVP